MPLIDVPTLLGIADRAAYQTMTYSNAVDLLSIEGGGYYFDRVTATNDPDVEIPTDRNYHSVDEQLPNLDWLLSHGTQLPTIIGSMDAHFARRTGPGGAALQTGGWDGYLYQEGERVSQWFNRLFFATRGFYMLAINVFSESEDLFGTADMSGGPTINYTDGVNYGNGADYNPANGSNYAGTQLKAKVVTMGASSLDIRLSVKNLNNNPVTIDVNIPGSTPVGTEIAIGTASDRFLDVMGVSLIPMSGYGTVGDTIEFYNLKERQIAL